MRENGPGGFANVLRDSLKMVNAYLLKLHGHKEQAPGWPDFFVAHRRLPGGCWVEVKAGGGKLSPNQERVMRQLLLRGAYAVVAEEVGLMLHVWQPGRETVCSCGVITGHAEPQLALDLLAGIDALYRPGATGEET